LIDKIRVKKRRERKSCMSYDLNQIFAFNIERKMSNVVEIDQSCSY